MSEADGEKKFRQEHYNLLKRCAEKGDMTEWNEWYEGYQKARRKSGEDTGAWLEGANLKEANLQGAYLEEAYLKEANLQGAHLERAYLEGAYLEGANLQGAQMAMAQMEGALLLEAHLQGADFIFAQVDSTTFITGDPKKIIDDDTDFTGVGLSAARIDPKLRTRLERNIRKKQWEEWYVKPRVYPLAVFLSEQWKKIRGNTPEEISKTDPPQSKEKKKKLTGKEWLKNIFVDIPTELFWWVSDYGSRTTRILYTFFGLNLFFTALYLWVVPHLPTFREGASPMFAELMYNTTSVDPFAAFIQSNMIVFSITDVATGNLDYIPMLFVLIHIVLGYGLLAALVTRFAIMFQSLSP
jgi:hypothetical protein